MDLLAQYSDDSDSEFCENSKAPEVAPNQQQPPSSTPLSSSGAAARPAAQIPASAPSAAPLAVKLPPPNFDFSPAQSGIFSGALPPPDLGSFPGGPPAASGGKRSFSQVSGSTLSIKPEPKTQKPANQALPKANSVMLPPQLRGRCVLHFVLVLIV